MPAAAIGTLVDLQAAFALLLAPGKVFLRLCQRGVTILRFARLISLGAVALLRKVSMARIFPREHVVECIETAQLCVELRFLLRPRRAILLRGHSPPSKQITSPYTKLRRFSQTTSDTAKPVIERLAAITGGAFAPTIASALVMNFGIQSLGWYLGGMALVALVALAFFRESKDVDFEQ